MGNPKSQANDELVSASHLLPRLMAAFHPFPPSASRSPLSKRQTVRYCRLVEDLIAQGILEWLYDLVERRWGTPAAWAVTVGMFASLVNAGFWVLARLG